MDGLEIPVLDAPRRLARHDKRSDFTCGNDELDTWFHRYAWQNQRANNAVTYVSSPGFCGGLFRPLPFVLLCVCFLLVAV